MRTKTAFVFSGKLYHFSVGDSSLHKVNILLSKGGYAAAVSLTEYLCFSGYLRMLNTISLGQQTFPTSGTSICERLLLNFIAANDKFLQDGLWANSCHCHCLSLLTAPVSHAGSRYF